jgi:hypothetical protein
MIGNYFRTGWVEYCQVLAYESVGNVKPNMTRWGDRTGLR